MMIERAIGECYLVLLTASIFIGQHFTLSHCPPSPICQNCTPTGIMVASHFSQVRPPTLCHSQTSPRCTCTNHPFLVRLHSLKTPPGTPHMCDRPVQPVSFGCRPERCAPWLSLSCAILVGFAYICIPTGVPIYKYRPGVLSFGSFRIYRAKPVGLPVLPCTTDRFFACCPDRFAFLRFPPKLRQVSQPFGRALSMRHQLLRWCGPTLLDLKFRNWLFFPIVPYSMLSRPGLSMHFLVPTGLHF